MTRLVIGLSGPLTLRWQGEAIAPPTSPRAQLLLARLARAPTGLPRAALAELVWGPDRLRNLRQELYRLKQLSGAKVWLDAGDPVRVLAEVQFDPASRTWLEGVARHRLTEASRAWLESEEAGWRADLDAAPEGAVMRALLPLLTVSADEPPTLDVLVRATGHPLDAIVTAWERVDALPGLTPQHAQAAHRRLAMAWSGTHPRRAGEHWQAAGEPDRAAQAYLDAGLDERAARLAERPTLRLQALEARVTRLERERASALDQAITAFERAALTHADDRAWVHARLARARHHLTAGRHEEAEMTARPFLDDPDHEPAARLILAQRAMVEGRFEAASVHYTRVLDLEDAAAACIATTGLGVVSALGGDPVAARAHHVEALRRGRALERPDLVCRSLLNLGADDQRSGHLDSSIAHFREVAELAPSTGDPTLLGLALTNLGITLIQRGSLGGARPVATAAIDAADSPRIRALAFDLRAEVELLCGRHAESARWSEQAMELHTRLGDVNRRTLSRGNAALARLCEGEASALDDARTALRGLADRPLVTAELRTQLALLPPVALATDFIDVAGDSPAGELARVRRDPERPWTEPLDRMAEEPGPHQPLAAALARHRGRDTALEPILTTHTDGLLGAQREALQTWLKRWVRGG